MKIYVDTCVLDKIIDESGLLEKILRFKPLSFYISIKTLEEVNNIHLDDGARKLKILEICKSMNIITTSASLSHGGLVSSSTMFSTQDLDKVRLSNLFTPNPQDRSKLSENYIPHFQNNRGKQITNDADHIYNAWKSKCEFFLTVDRKSIIKHYNLHKSEVDAIISPMRIVDPFTLLKILPIAH